MKRNLLTLTIITLATVLLLAACQTKSAVNEKALAIPEADTAGLAAFQQWKAMNERKNFEAYQQSQEQEAAPAVVKNTTPAKTVYKQPANTTAPAPAPAPAKKKGWSKAAKGAVIGTTAGAVTGVLVSKKNKALGGVIGGVAGGGLGYVIGRSMDKKDGRVK